MTHPLVYGGVETISPSLVSCALEKKGTKRTVAQIGNGLFTLANDRRYGNLTGIRLGIGPEIGENCLENLVELGAFRECSDPQHMLDMCLVV